MTILFSLPPLAQALLASLFSWGMTALGASLVLLTRRPRADLMDALLALGAGVMLASAFFSLLAPAIDLAGRIGQSPWLIACTGFLLGGCALMALARAIPLGEHSRPAMLVASITLHNIPEGLAIGVAFAADAPIAAWMLAIGIALQNLPEGAAVSLPLRRDGLPRARAFFFGQLSGLVEPFSAVIGCMLATHIRGMLPAALAFAAGAMVQVVVSELIPESQRGRRPLVNTIAALAGFALMMALDVAFG